MSTFERLAIIVEANAGKAIAEFKQVGLAAKKLEGETTGAGKSVGLLGKLSSTSGALLKAGMVAGIAGAGLAIAKFAGDSIDAFTGLAAQVKQFQRVTLATAEDSSRLVGTFRALNIDVDTATTFFGRFAKNLGPAGDGLAKVGVSAVRTSAGNVNMAQTFLKVVDAYNATTNASERAAIGNAAFGRGWITLAPLLARGREGVQELYAEAEKHGLILSEEDLRRAAELKVAMRDLKGAVEGLEVSAGKTLVPFLTKVVGLLDDFLAGVDAVANPPTPSQDDSIWGKLSRAIHGAGEDLADYAGFALAGVHVNHELADSAGDAAVNETILGDATDGLSDSIVKVVDADRALVDARQAVDAANRSLVKATADYNKLLKDGAVDEAKVADARRGLADATRSLHSAQREQIKSQGEYNKALAYASLYPGLDSAQEKLADAGDNLADANDNVASALERQTGAAADLAKAKAGDPDYQQKLADAKQAVADATDRVGDAEYAAAQKAQASAGANAAAGVAINGHADAVARLAQQLKDEVFQHPELAAFLNPQIAALLGLAGNNVAPPPPGPTPAEQLAQSQLFNTGALPVGDAGFLPSSGTTTNNVTINATTGLTDAQLIAKEVMWNLN